VSVEGRCAAISSSHKSGSASLPNSGSSRSSLEGAAKKEGAAGRGHSADAEFQNRVMARLPLDAEANFSVLLEFQESKSVITIKPPDDLLSVIQKKVRRINKDIRVVIECDYEQDSSSENVFLLQ